MRVLWILLFVGRAWAAEPCLQGVPRCSEKVGVSASQSLTVYRSHPLAVDDENIDSIVLVIHGVLRNANEYFEAVAIAATVEKVTSRTAILAPHFKNQEDAPAADEIRWADDDWKRGELSAGSADRLSTFTVLDRLLARALRAYPHAKRVVVTGHSAGGQVLSRYSVGTRMPQVFPGVAWRFVVANPSSHLYLSPERPRPVAGCAGYDDYPYGLQKPNEYFAAIPAETLIQNARDRNIVVFLGGADTETELLDQSCEANAQGSNRLERGRLYYRQLRDWLHPVGLREVIVPGLGHFGDRMYQSAEGRAVLFH